MYTKLERHYLVQADVDMAQKWNQGDYKSPLVEKDSVGEKMVR